MQHLFCKLLLYDVLEVVPKKAATLQSGAVAAAQQCFVVELAWLPSFSIVAS